MPSILVTGVSTGIGRAVAELFDSSGWEVTGTVRDPGRYPGGVLSGTRVVLEGLDLSADGSAEALARRVLDAGSCPDVVLNNAGTLLFAPIETTSIEDMRSVFEVNVFQQLKLASAFVPAMRTRGSGQLVFVTSLGGRMTFPFFGVYNASKHALEGFAEGLWHELKPFGIQVKAIEPGFVETAIWGKVLPESAEELQAPEPYLEPMRSMMKFETSITDRTSSQKAAEEVRSAILNQSDRMRYPVAAYSRPILNARRLLGDQRLMRFFHKRWMGADEARDL